ncbi:fungal trichothecene efflux pump-domain-containing protein [Colletotrichum cereale]|nr:fungal trichothecene efflux pump-domain-containing protein [Colletotrichum cereale]
MSGEPLHLELPNMAAPPYSSGPAGEARNPRELGNYEADVENDGHGSDHLPDDVISLVHMDGTVRQIQTKILGDPMHWFNKTLGCIMMAQNLGSTAAWLGWIALTNNHIHVNQELGLPANDQRLSTTWLVGSSIGFLLVGRLSDLYGRRWLIVSTSLLGFVGSILGCLGGSTSVLIASNICNGVAAAARLSFGFVVGEIIVATLLGPFVAALVSTAVMSHALHESSSRWRWSYGLEIGCAFISTCVYFLCYFPPSCKQLNVGGGTRLQMAKDLDIGGTLLFVSGCVQTIVGLSSAGASNQWDSQEVVATLLGTFMSFVLFFVYVFSRNSYDIAWHTSMLGTLFFSGMALAGFFIAYIPRVRILCHAAASVAMLSLVYLAAMKPDRYAEMTASACFLCFALGFIETVTWTGVTCIWGAQDIGLAFGVVGCLCSLGCAFARQLKENLTKYVDPVVQQAGLPPSSVELLYAAIRSGGVWEVPGVDLPTLDATIHIAVSHAYAGSFKTIFLLLMIFVVSMWFNAMFVPKLETSLNPSVARRLEPPSGFGDSNRQDEEQGIELGVVPLDA